MLVLIATDGSADATRALLVAEGDPREEIIRVAHERRVDLTVLGARGLGAVKGWLLGSVSLSVTEYAPCPVLIAKGTPRRPRCAVVAVDGSDGAREAVHFLSIFGFARDMTVRLLTVVESEQFLVATPLAGPPEEALRRHGSERRAAAENILSAAAVELAGAAREIERSVAEGIPAEEVVKATKRPDVDLVVVGARGLGAVKRFIFGSVSERVLRHSRCPRARRPASLTAAGGVKGEPTSRWLEQCPPDRGPWRE